MIRPGDLVRIRRKGEPAWDAALGGLEAVAWRCEEAGAMVRPLGFNHSPRGFFWFVELDVIESHGGLGPRLDD